MGEAPIGGAPAWVVGVELLPDCVTLWIGPRLGRLERACLRSVMRTGHRLTLYCYERPDGVPEGVDVEDAREIVPADRIVRYRNGSYALFSNLFRYQLQRRSRGTWVDCDVYLVRPLDGRRPYLIGEEAPGILNGGVLRIPADSPLLSLLLEPFDGNSVPSWLPWRHRVPAHLHRMVSGRTAVSRMPWGTTGPLALTNAVKATGIDVEALPSHLLHPVRWQDAGWIADPRKRPEDRITPETVSIHLWNERIKHLKDVPAPRGSFLHRLQSEGA